jgi:hypothetical protein
VGPVHRLRHRARAGRGRHHVARPVARRRDVVRRRGLAPIAGAGVLVLHGERWKLRGVEARVCKREAPLLGEVRDGERSGRDWGTRIGVATRWVHATRDAVLYRRVDGVKGRELKHTKAKM